MSDFDQRLRAADPVAGMSYQHPNADAMISRIEARAPLARRHVLRSFQLKMASAVTMAAVLTVGGIAALEGAVPALQVLTLSAAKSSGHHAASALGASVPRRPAAASRGRASVTPASGGSVSELLPWLGVTSSGSSGVGAAGASLCAGACPPQARACA